MWTNNIRKKTRAYKPDFYDWLKMPMCDTQGPLATSRSVTHEDYVNYFLQTIEEILARDAYQINDLNKFREDIARYIYTLSDNY
jgi:hypothetical protein